MPTAQQMYTASPEKRQVPIDPELHAHSPTRSRALSSLADRQEPSTLLQAHTFPMAPPPLPSFLRGSKTTLWGPETGMPDPFVDRRNNRRSDTSMPDYSDSGSERGGLSAASIRNSTLAPLPQPDHKFEDMINLADSPTHLQSGLEPPSNTRVSSMENTPLSGKKGVEQKVNFPGGSANMLKDLRLPGQFIEGRKGSDTSTYSQHYDESEVPSVRSKKEGSNPRSEFPYPGLNRSEDALGHPGAPALPGADGKRKRNSGSRKVSKTENLDVLSPRKVSRLEGEPELPGQGNQTGDENESDPARATNSSSATNRHPLGELKDYELSR